MRSVGRDIPGDMAGPFYHEVGACASFAAEAETRTLLETGALPTGPLTLDHYRAAVAEHKDGVIGDAELAGLALLVHLQRDAGAHAPRNLLQPRGVRELDDARPRRALPPFLRMLSRHRIRRIKDMAQTALYDWASGRTPAILAMGRVSAEELLGAQARGLRHVAVGLPLGDFRATDEDYPGGFTHHDLCHLAQFHRGTHAGQVGFFEAFRLLAAEDPTLLTSAPGTPPGLDVSLVASDTNGDVRLLLTLFLERMTTRAGDASPAHVAALLTRLGVPERDAHEAAPLLKPARGAFLARLAPHFERRGSVILGS